MSVEALLFFALAVVFAADEIIFSEIQYDAPIKADYEYLEVRLFSKPLFVAKISFFFSSVAPLPRRF